MKTDIEIEAEEEAQLAAFLAMIPTLSVEKKVKLFTRTRSAKSVAKKVFDTQEEKFNKIMQACENSMLAEAKKQGVTGFKTAHGTTYIAETAKISIADDAAFFGFVLERGDLDFFERRVSSTHVEEYIATLKGTPSEGHPPPGLNIFRESVMRVRKASEK
jgi:hypothetical protein